MLTAPLALLLSIAVILVLVRLKVPVGFGVLAGCIVLIVLVVPFNNVPSLLLKTVTYKQTWQLLIVVPCTLAFSSVMEQKGLLTRMAGALESIGPRLAIHVLPAVIGLVPMPAGALVAATAVKGTAGKLRLSPQAITFINYWFRHIWEFSMPFYPAIIVTSTVLGIPVSTVVKILLPMTGVAIVLGAAVSYQILRKAAHTAKGPRDSVKNILLIFIKAAWPIALLIILIFAKVEAWIAFPAVLILVMFQQRVRWAQIKKALKYALNPLIILLLLAVMLYQMTVNSSDSASVLIAYMQSIGLPSLLMLAGLPLLIGLAIGYGPAISGISMPLLLPFIVSNSGINAGYLLVACVSGMVGQLLSPAHLCFCLSAEYFKTTLGKVYRYTLPICLVIEAAVILVHNFIS
jgi:integral membrane protein (TIGR00529 family)